MALEFWFSNLLNHAVCEAHTHGRVNLAFSYA